MKHFTATALALALTATAGAASAQQYSSYPTDTQGGYTDYARVIRATPVYDSRGAYAASTGGPRCTESRTYSNGYGDSRYNDPYDRNGDGYRDDGYYAGNDGYARDAYGRPYTRPTSPVGSTAATVIGGIVGAVVGSQVGGGSARYATSAIGTMVGSQVGKQIYDNSHRQPVARTGRVVTCDPMSAGAYENGRNVSMYDVTYEYGGRTYTTRTPYDPGNRLRVRVDVRPE
ncbi:glycine zipper 2TM domain-containing protein [Lysobacter xanthus]